MAVQVDTTRQVLVTRFNWGQKIKCQGRR